MESRLLLIAATGLLSGIVQDAPTAFLQDTLEMALSLPPKSRVDIAVALEQPLESLPSNVTQTDIPTFLIREGSPGERITQMFEYGFSRGAAFVCVIGSDTPQIPGAYVLEAFGRLMQHRHSVVVGPADGDKFYLLGVSDAEPYSLLKDISGETPNVLTEMLQRAIANELSLSLLPSIQVIDTPEHRERLSRDLRRGVASAPQTQIILRNTGLE